jgi:hypothetical protein
MAFYGQAPAANQYQVGGLWMQMENANPAGAPKVWKVHVWAYAQPRVDFDDGTGYFAVPQITAPSGSTPGKYELAHTYTFVGSFKPKVKAADGVYTEMPIFVGPMPYFDSDKSQLTIAERRQREAQRVKDMNQPTETIGAPNNTVKRIGTVRNPTKKQIDA